MLFGIHDGSLDAARQWVEAEQLPFAVLNDPDRRVGIELGMSALDGERYVTERNVVLFGIHDGSLDAARQWVEAEQLPFAVLNDPDRRVGIELGMSALDGERYVKDPSDGKRPAVVIDEHSVICEWESDMNHTDQIAKLLERL